MDEIRYGIVLGGGFSRGACQLGFLKSLTDNISIDNIKCLSASSIGTINSIAVSCEGIDTMIQIWQDSDYGNVFSFRKAISRGLIEDIMDKLYKPRDITQYFTMCRLPQLSAHYYNVTDMNKRQLYNAVDVSLAYPFVNGLFKRYNKMAYIDGGLVDNIPLYPLIGEDIDIIIILHCDPRYRPPQKLASKTNAVIMDIDVTLRAEMWQKNTRCNTKTSPP